MNKRDVISKIAYIFVDIVMWVAMLKSRVHATLAGVLLAMFIPISSEKSPQESPLKDL
jgi:NhaA family Na+:H+ antiporter